MTRQQQDEHEETRWDRLQGLLLENRERFQNEVRSLDELDCERLWARVNAELKKFDSDMVTMYAVYHAWWKRDRGEVPPGNEFHEWMERELAQ